jgi:intracellular septation protein A
MLPLIVFIIVDSLFNNIKISIISAILFAAGQLLFFYLKTGAFDWFVLLDVVLIAGFGFVSLLLKNEIFFKVKPAIIDVAGIILLLVLYFSPDRLLIDYIGRYLPKGLSINPAAAGALKIRLLIMCGYLAIHIGAVLYTAKFSSRKMWAFVAGPGLYLLFIPVMAYVLVKRMKRQKRRA